MNTVDVEHLIAERYKKHGNYKQMYQEHARLAEQIWSTTDRNDYEADVWYNRNRNEICLEMLGDICEGKRVLSVGGGQWIEGEFLKSITAGEIVRTDIVGDITEKGVIEADASDLPFEDGSFDIVFCRELIEHVLDPDAVFLEIKRVLKPEGYLLITTPNAYTMALDGTFHVRLYTPVTFLQEIEYYGFKVIEKRGNIPYILHGLMTYSTEGYTIALEDFKEIDRITRDYEDRYYLSTQLFVLCQKESKER